MKSDNPSMAVDRIERAHLADPADRSHVIHRYEAGPEFDGLLQRFWIPVWSVPPGAEALQKVLQYPVALIVISAEYARFYGVMSGLSTTTLTGDGWAVGVLFAPAAGFLLAGTSMADYTDRFVDVAEVLAADGLVDRVRAAMTPAPSSATAHQAAMAAFADALRRFLPVDDDGRLVNEVVAFVEGDPEVTRVSEVCAAFDLSERTLQRLVRRRLGLSPKWLIQRRRLHEAAAALRVGSAALAEVAVELGYADQAHFSRDFRAVTAMTPGEFATLHAARSDPS